MVVTCYNHRWRVIFIRQCLFVTFIYHLYFQGHTLLVFFLSLFFPCFFSLFACSLHILVTKENMNTPELNIQESVISSMTPCKGTQILLFFFFFFPLLSLSVSYSKWNNQKLHQYKYTRMQCWYGTMSKENFNVLDMSWTLSRTCPVQVSRPNIPLYSVIIKDSN